MDRFDSAPLRDPSPRPMTMTTRALMTVRSGGVWVAKSSFNASGVYLTLFDRAGTGIGCIGPLEPPASNCRLVELVLDRFCVGPNSEGMVVFDEARGRACFMVTNSAGLK
jgi:hypothetical protein